MLWEVLAHAKVVGEGDAGVICCRWFAARCYKYV